MNEALIKLIDKEARGIRNKILKKQKPVMKFPLRSLSNVRFDPRAGYFEMGRKTKERTLAVSTVKTFAQELKMIVLSKMLVETADIATKREAYYVAKGWDEEIRFGEQGESDTVLDDVEALFLVNREQLGFVTEEKGGEVARKPCRNRLRPRHWRRVRGRLHQVRLGGVFYPDFSRGPALSLGRQVHFGHRDRRHVPALGETQLLADCRLHSGFHGRGADTSYSSLHPSTVG